MIRKEDNKWCFSLVSYFFFDYTINFLKLVIIDFLFRYAAVKNIKFFSELAFMISTCVKGNYLLKFTEIINRQLFLTSREIDF